MDIHLGFFATSTIEIFEVTDKATDIATILISHLMVVYGNICPKLL